MDKVSSRDFAEHAGISPTTVGKYLAAWDALAQAGLVPFREELEPGQDVELPDQYSFGVFLIIIGALRVGN